MTDKEIIKALECCAGEEPLCRECAYGGYPLPVCRESTVRNSLDLIKRQQGEIKRLEKEKVKHHLIATVSIDEDALKKFKDEGLKKVECDIIKVRNETIKELKKRAKILVIPQKTAEGYTREIILKSDFDNLVKEMTEGQG